MVTIDDGIDAATLDNEKHDRKDETDDEDGKIENP